MELNKLKSLKAYIKIENLVDGDSWQRMMLSLTVRLEVRMILRVKFGGEDDGGYDGTGINGNTDDHSNRL